MNAEVILHEKEDMLILQSSFNSPITNIEHLRSVLFKACKQLSKVLIERKLACKLIQVRLINDRLVFYSRTKEFSNPLQDDIDIYIYAKILLENIRDYEHLRVIQIAVGVGRLQPHINPALDEAIQKIQAQFGTYGISIGFQEARKHE